MLGTLILLWTFILSFLKVLGFITVTWTVILLPILVVAGAIAMFVLVFIFAAIVSVFMDGK